MEAPSSEEHQQKWKPTDLLACASKIVATSQENNAQTEKETFANACCDPCNSTKKQ